MIISGEEIYNDTLDTLVISGQNRSVIRHPARDELAVSYTHLTLPTNGDV